MSTKTATAPTIALKTKTPAKIFVPKVNYITVRHVASMLNCSVGAVYDMKDAGTLPGCLVIGRMVRYDEQKIQDYIDAHVTP
jgi:excisionase family DNA binding protein